MTYNLPTIRGSYRFNAPLAKTNWFGVGGNAEVLFKPEDVADLADFLRQMRESRGERQESGEDDAAGSVLPPPCGEGWGGGAEAVLTFDAPLPSPPRKGEGTTEQASPLVTVIGVGSNLIIRDGGIEGVVVRLGRGFTDIQVKDDVLEAGAAALDVHVARVAADHGRAGLEFLSGIPGTIGGALAMNAGAYGRETADVLIKAEAVTPAGHFVTLTLDEMRYSYRHYGGPQGLIFTRAWFRTTADAPDTIHARIAEIQASREATQPIRERTGGSTFRNPESWHHHSDFNSEVPPQSLLPQRGRRLDEGASTQDTASVTAPSPNLSPVGGEGYVPARPFVKHELNRACPPKAWQLIDAAGCRGLKVGAAQMSELHCNFMINTGGATAADLENLGEEVRARVKAHSGVELEWEIKRVGRHEST